MKTNEQHIDKIKQANKITNRKTIYAAGAGLIPFPVVDTAALLGVQLTMIRSIAELYDTEYKKHIVKSIIASLIGSISSVGLVKLIPGLGTFLGSATAAITGAATTYALGRVFTQHFDQGGTLLDFDPITSREYFQKEYEAGQLFVKQQKLVDIEDAVIVKDEEVDEKEQLLKETAELQQTLFELQEDIQLLVAQKTAKQTKQAETIDFSIIEGIGPKISGLLNTAGIHSMAQLAKTKVPRLQQILKDAGGRYYMADPSTWPEQATLVAEDDIEGLNLLQDELHGGKKQK